jgi:hypothetical protein
MKRYCELSPEEEQEVIRLRMKENLSMYKIKKIMHKRYESIVHVLKKYKLFDKRGFKFPKGGLFVYWATRNNRNELNEKIRKIKEKWSKNASGKNNPMYGKPSPQGSGNGWKCWYKNIFFRSLRELSFFISKIEKENIPWESGEKQKFTISYEFKGQRTYRPDFFINHNTLIEIKPKKLWKTPLIKAKVRAAIQFCKKNGFKYKLIDSVICTNEIKIRYLAGQILPQERYKKRFNHFFS